MWRTADPSDDEAFVAMSLALNAEDPGPDPVPPEHPRRTLAALRAAPARGRVLVLEAAEGLRGYALLISCWSNELGGEIVVIDELYVAPDHRNRGHAGRLLDAVAIGEHRMAGVVALVLETTPDNASARRLYERHGFRAKNLAMRRLTRDA